MQSQTVLRVNLFKKQNVHASKPPDSNVRCADDLRVTKLKLFGPRVQFFFFFFLAGSFLSGSSSLLAGIGIPNDARYLSAAAAAAAFRSQKSFPERPL